MYKIIHSFFVTNLFLLTRRMFGIVFESVIEKIALRESGTHTHIQTHRQSTQMHRWKWERRTLKSKCIETLEKVFSIDLTLFNVNELCLD